MFEAVKVKSEEKAFPVVGLTVNENKLESPKLLYLVHVAPCSLDATYFTEMHTS